MKSRRKRLCATLVCAFIRVALWNVGVVSSLKSSGSIQPGPSRPCYNSQIGGGSHGRSFTAKSAISNETTFSSSSSLAASRNWAYERETFAMMSRSNFTTLERRLSTSTALYAVNKKEESERAIESIASSFASGEGKEIKDTTKESKGISSIVIAGSVFGSVLAGSFGYYTIHQGEPTVTLSNLAQDLGMGFLTTVLAGIFVKIWTTLVEMDKLDPRDARKIIHTGSAPLFMLFWVFFSDAPWSRFFAVAVPFINMLRLYQAGSGTEEAALARAVSRSGDIKEALGGPFAYVVILVIITALFWRDNMSGIMAITALAAGDGMADLVGRRIGKFTGKWPFSSSKSYAGTAAFALSSFLAGVFLCSWFQHFGAFSLELSRDEQVLRIAFISLAASLVELIDSLDDNWTVPISAAVLSYLLLY